MSISDHPRWMKLLEESDDENAPKSEKHEFAVRLAALIGQVCNGGFTQWVDNGYASEDGLDITDEELSRLGTENAAKAHEMLERLRPYIDQSAEQQGCFGSYWKNERSGDDMPEGYDEAQEMDDPFYEFCDALGDEVEEVLAKDELPPIKKWEIRPSTSGVRYPSIRVKLVGENGNAFNLLGIVSNQLKRAGVKKDEINSFMNEAMSGNYDHLLATCMKWVNVA